MSKICLKADGEELGNPEDEPHIFAPSHGLESNFSGIEELEAEHLESSVENSQSAKKYG